MAVIFVQDPDFTLHVGDALEELRAMPAESVDCCVTSPPYWGLRDYETGAWDGGDPGCSHREDKPTRVYESSRLRNDGRKHVGPYESEKAHNLGVPFRDVCGKCGATRVDQQLGLEATPDLYVERLVGVFREVRRVLKPHGTLWLNLGDSYASGDGLGRNDAGRNFTGGGGNREGSGNPGRQGSHKRDTGLKPKDLVGIPWRVAFALQQDGWYLRSDIIWSKPNPMPESVTDRPTKAHEYVFLLSKGPRYFFDQEAVREAYQPSSIERSRYQAQDHRSGVVGNTESRQNGVKGTKGADLIRRGYPVPNPAGRNVRSVWEIATRPFSEAHFATFPPELVRRCILAGSSERGMCPECGKPWGREGTSELVDVWHRNRQPPKSGLDTSAHEAGDQGSRRARDGHVPGHARQFTTTGWAATCDHDCPPVPAVVLDPFMGSGTTALVAREQGRRSVGIELNQEYAAMAARRLGQLSLLAADV